MKKFFENTRKPTKSWGGKMMLKIMNAGHNKMSLWGLSHPEIADNAVAADIGCGGGKNIANLLHKADKGKVYGVDYSEASVEKSKRVNKKAIQKDKAEVVQGNVSSLPFGDGKFDIVTAFETVYFWPDLINDFREVKRVLKNGGQFLICNEMSKPEESEVWINMLHLSIYTKEKLSEALTEAGFSSVKAYSHKNGKWICVVAQNK